MFVCGLCVFLKQLFIFGHNVCGYFSVRAFAVIGNKATNIYTYIYLSDVNVRLWSRHHHISIGVCGKHIFHNGKTGAIDFSNPFSSESYCCWRGNPIFDIIVLQSTHK